jgi:predicted nucleic acid-binding protein
MKYVLDCSVALKTVLPEVDSGKAIRLLKEYRHAIHELLAPDIFAPEVANGLASAERQARIQSAEASIFLSDVMQNAPVIHSSTPLLARAIEISVANKLAVYDCIYLALAEAEGCEMVSADDMLVRKMRAKFPFLVRLADLP